MKVTMRRSCHFCRSRKIKCSGQSKCDACRERSIDCVYGTEASKGRPRGSGTSKSSEAVGRGLQVDRTAVDMGSAEPEMLGHATVSPGSTSPTLSRRGSGRTMNDGIDSAARARRGSGGTVATELEHLFHVNFSVGASEGGISGYQEAIASYNRRRMSHPDHPGDAAASAASDRAVLAYEGSLALLTQELVEMLSLRYGGLGCHHLGSCGGRFFVRSLEADPAESMFDSAVPEENPIHTFDDYRTLQLIDVFFANHPLSTILSKTMLLREYRSNTHDEILLAVILADAIELGAPCTQGPSEALYRYAAAGFRARSLQNCSLSTAQALVLLGWNCLCMARAKRATCYFGYASQIAVRLRTAAQMPAVRLSRINGVDVGAVENELIGNVYWIAFAVTLWSFMQFDGSFAHLLPGHLPTDFPPVDEACSAVAQLDIVSDNVSTLQAQARTIRELWQLSHIASTIGHIYALFPREPVTPTAPDTPSSLGWQARPLHQLRQLFTPHQDISVLCVRIRQILAEASSLLETQVVAPTSQAYVLTAYHTVIIYLLFPKSGLDGSSERITGEIVDAMCRSARAIVDIAARLDGAVSWSPLNADPGPSTVANMLTLGLDACGRAMACFLAKVERGALEEGQLVLARRVELASLAAALHKIAKSEKVSSARRLRIVKKQLKRVLLQLQHSGATTPILGMPDELMGLATPASIMTPGSMMTADFTDRSSLEMDLSPPGGGGGAGGAHGVGYAHQSFFPPLGQMGGMTTSPSELCLDRDVAAAAAATAHMKHPNNNNKPHHPHHLHHHAATTTTTTLPTSGAGPLMATMSPADMSGFGLGGLDMSFDGACSNSSSTHHALTAEPLDYGRVESLEQLQHELGLSGYP